MSPGHCVSYATRARLYFGDTWYESGTTTKFKFATYERDSESTNDYARARSYINRFGRFSSPDPVEPMEGQKAQALNRYPYVTNDPVNLTDPTGLKTTPGPFVVPFLQGPTDSSPGGGDCLVPSGFLGGLDIFFCLVGGPAGEAGGGGGGYRPCDVHLSASNVTDQPCSSEKTFIADMQIEGKDVTQKQGGRVIFTKNSVTTEVDGGVIKVGEPYQDTLDRTKWHPRSKGFLQWRAYLGFKIQVRQ